MSNPEHLVKLKEGSLAWNQWRKENPAIRPDFSGADLTGVDLMPIYPFPTDLVGANFSGANLSSANLTKANLSEADLHGAIMIGATLAGADFIAAQLFDADLSSANLIGADLTSANLFGANLTEATLSEARLHGTNFTEADLSGANLKVADFYGAVLVRTILEGADLTGCNVYGVSVWDAKLERAIQSNLVITPKLEPEIQVDSLEVAQFIYLLLNNVKIRQVIDTIGKKTVLILGRFTPQRKAVLDSIREALRHSGFLPILFDFEKPRIRDTEETIITLAGLARFIIADITEPRSIPQELAAIVPTFPSVPVQPLLQVGYEPWGMYDHIKRYPWVLPLVEYVDQQSLLTDLELKVIVPAEAKAREQRLT